ncbi:putative Site-specific recombinase XerC [Verrucomicrobia bacterium]|nr:putative Site-specific recombinase XerC [Verrucomicrobiota bacterium]
MSSRRPVGFASWESVKLPIYYCPVKVKRKPVANASGEGRASSPSPDPVFKIYDSYQIAYYEGGAWRNVRASTLEKAKTKGKKIAKRLAENGSQAIGLPQEDCRIYVSAKHILQPHNLQVDAAARLVDDLLRRLNGTSLQQAVDFFNAHGKRVIVGAKTAVAYEAYIEDLKRRGVGIHHLRDVKRFVGAFLKAFPGEIAIIRTSEIDAYLNRLGGRARNKNNARDRIISFFNFMVQKGYLPKGIDHAAKSTTSFTDPRPVITSEEEAVASAEATDLYLPEDMGRILAAAEIDERVTLELKAFSGLRTEELARMWWVLINAKAGYINVTDAIAKVNQRAVPILENLKRRLAAYPETEKRDKVSKRWGSSNSLYHAWKRVTDKAGLPYKKNAFRNSYISYRLAQTKDINLVAYESGNSPEIIRKYYLDLVTPEQAADWFSL